MFAQSVGMINEKIKEMLSKMLEKDRISFNLFVFTTCRKKDLEDMKEEKKRCEIQFNDEANNLMKYLKNKITKKESIEDLPHRMPIMLIGSTMNQNSISWMRRLLNL